MMPPLNKERRSEYEYLAYALDTNRRMEYSQGWIDNLPRPTIEHQLIVRFLLDALRKFVEPKKLGTVLFGPVPLQLMPNEYREPDLIFNFKDSHLSRDKKYYEGADLVMEVVSDDSRSRERDYEKKRRDYASAGIREYWIVDPAEKCVTVLALEGKDYVQHASLQATGEATSKLLDGFAVDIARIFEAGQQ